MRRSLTLLVLLVLLLLASSAAATRYTLRRGDTLGGVARRLGVNVDALARANGITHPDRVKVGQTLQVPGKTPAAKPAAKAAKPTPAKSKAKPTATPKPAPKPIPAPAKGGVSTSDLKPIVDVHQIAGGLPPTYVAQKGDTVRVVASRYKVTVSALTKANPGVNLNRISVGQVLQVPAPPVWLCPVNGPHSWRDDFGAFRSDTGFHEGNDVLAPRGTPVVAPVGGTLQLKQGTIGGNAFYLRGDDGNTYYGAHLDRYVRDSGRIEAGIQIGVVGDTGDAKGGVTHLHFEFHPGNGDAVDPYYTLKAWC